MDIATDAAMRLALIDARSVMMRIRLISAIPQVEHCEGVPLETLHSVDASCLVVFIEASRLYCLVHDTVFSHSFLPCYSKHAVHL
jgi:hypothetical protein